MHLNIISEHFDIIEAKLRIYGCLEEADEAPRWSFDYSNHKTDPSPDILVLGDWHHPRTKNHLIGGINLHYLNTAQRDTLSKILPEIVKRKDLYERYWIGRKLMPEVFQNYYRTYNAAHIKGLDTSTFYPKYGYTKAAYNWVKDKIASMFKSKEQREADKLPKYPSDLSGVQDNLEMAVRKAQQSTSPSLPEPVEPQEPSRQQKLAGNELQRKRDIQQQQRVTGEPEPTDNINDLDLSPDADITDLELKQAEYEKNNPDNQQDQQIRDEQKIAAQQQAMQKQKQAELLQQQQQKLQTQKSFYSDIKKNQSENQKLGESIRYYSPVHKKYIVEYIDL